MSDIVTLCITLRTVHAATHCTKHLLDLNSSLEFNLFGEPMVVKPRDAVRSYFCSG